MVGNYSSDNPMSPPSLNHVANFDSFADLSTGNFLLAPEMLATINASWPIHQIRFFCTKPTVPKLCAHFKTRAENVYGIIIRDLCIKMSGQYSNPYLWNGLQPLPGDQGYMSQRVVYSFGKGIYDHPVYKPADTHLVLIENRKDCDDTRGQHEGTWQYYIR